MTRPLNWMAAVGALTLAMLHAVAIPVFADVPVPPLKARVTDLTATFNAEQRAALEQKLAAFEAKKGSQIAVLIVPTTQPEAVEQYSIRVAEQWKLGRKGVDDGILLLIAKNDRKLRLEVGRGLEGAIPDAIAKRIVSDVIAPRFKEGDFYGGIAAGVNGLISVIERESLPPPKPRASSALPRPSVFVPLPQTSDPQPVTDSHGFVINLLGIKLTDVDLWFGGIVFALALSMGFGVVHGAWWGLVSIPVTGVLMSQIIYLIVYRTWSLSVLRETIEIVFFVLVCFVFIFLLGLLGSVFSGGGRSGDDGGGVFSGGGGDFGGGGASGDW